MPKVLPTLPEVDWPTDEGTLGIVGVAPWATIEFCKSFYSMFEAAKDWHFPRVILDINTKIPSRGRHLELGETDPSPAISATIAELAKQGATVAVVPCNTAHVLYDKWAATSPIPVPNIVQATIDLARESEVSRVCPLTSKSLADHDIYGRAIEVAGISCRRLHADEQGLLNSLIGEIKIHGRASNDSVTALQSLMNKLASDGVDGIVLGCTELSGLENYSNASGIASFDSNFALARAAVRLLNLHTNQIVQ